MVDLHEMADTIRRHPSRIQEFTSPQVRQAYGPVRSARECLEWAKVLLDEYEWMDNEEKAAEMRNKIVTYRTYVDGGFKAFSTDPVLESCIQELFPLYSNSLVSTNVGLKHEE